MRSQTLDRRPATAVLATAGIVLAGLFAAAALAARTGATFDEPFYVTAGLEVWRGHGHGALLRKGTMPLPIDLATLPLGIVERVRGTPWTVERDWPVLLLGARLGVLGAWAALLVAAAAVARASTTWAWAPPLAAAWLATEPTLLAHASLATTDVAVSGALLAFLAAFRAGRDAPWSRRVAVPASLLAVSVLCKASGLLFGLAGAILVEALAPLRALGPDDRRRRVRDLAAVTSLALVLVVVACGSGGLAEPSFVAWARERPEGALRSGLVATAEGLRIFPNGLEALVRQFRHNLQGHGHRTFLLGAVTPPRWDYFPLVLSMKLTVPFLVAPVLAAAVDRRSLASWPGAAALALLVVSLGSRVQIGVRFFLPLVALAGVAAIVAAGRIATSERRVGRFVGLVLLVGLAWKTAAVAAIWPHELTYVNDAWGGSAEGYRLVSDSNYDWGQGLPDLARWQRAHADRPLAVWYFGKDPELASLPMVERPLHALPIASAQDVVRWVGPGNRLAVGLTLLYGAPLGEPHRIAADFLRAQTPVDRTATFLIYEMPAGAGAAGSP